MVSQTYLRPGRRRVDGPDFPFPRVLAAPLHLPQHRAVGLEFACVCEWGGESLMGWLPALAHESREHQPFGGTPLLYISPPVTAGHQIKPSTHVYTHTHARLTPDDRASADGLRVCRRPAGGELGLDGAPRERAGGGGADRVAA